MTKNYYFLFQFSIFAQFFWFESVESQAANLTKCPGDDCYEDCFDLFRMCPGKIHSQNLNQILS